MSYELCSHNSNLLILPKYLQQKYTQLAKKEECSLTDLLSSSKRSHFNPLVSAKIEGGLSILRRLGQNILCNSRPPSLAQCHVFLFFFLLHILPNPRLKDQESNRVNQLAIWLTLRLSPMRAIGRINCH